MLPSTLALNSLNSEIDADNLDKQHERVYVCVLRYLRKNIKFKYKIVFGW